MGPLTPCRVCAHLRSCHLTPKQQRATGVSNTYVRLSVGIESIADILGNFDQALGKA